MGLDITYYREIKKLDAVFNDDGAPVDAKTGIPIEDFYWAIPNPHYDRSDGIAPGPYHYEDSDGFRAGSYSGYSSWRNQLAKLAGYKEEESRDGYGFSMGAWKADSGPFWELINFSDCEGTIGPKTSAKLAMDFANFQEMANAHEDEWFRDLYAEWRTAFETASNNGAVSFH